MRDDDPEGAADAARIELEYKALAKLRRRGLRGDALRQGFIEAVKHGRRTPDAAERQAARAGLAPFAHKPDVSNSIQCRSVAGLYRWRSLGSCGARPTRWQQWDPYRLGDKDHKGIWEWVRGEGALCIGFECKPYPPASLKSLGAVGGSVRRCSLRAAMAALVNAGANDRLRATAINALTGGEVTVTASMWSRLTFRDAHKPTRVVANGEGIPNLHAFKIRTADLMAVFEPAVPEDAQRTPPTPAASRPTAERADAPLPDEPVAAAKRTISRNELERLVSKYLESFGDSPPPRDAVVEYVRGARPDNFIPKKIVYEVRSGLVPEESKKGGRRRRKKSGA